MYCRYHMYSTGMCVCIHVGELVAREHSISHSVIGQSLQEFWHKQILKCLGNQNIFHTHMYKYTCTRKYRCRAQRKVK